MSTHSTIQQLASQAAAAHGLVLVSARMTGGGKYQTLEVLLETPEGTSPTLDACTAVSKALARELDTQDPIKGRYTLEVGSPGLERPLLTPTDFQRFIGRNAKVRLTSYSNMSGTIAAADATGITLHTPEPQTLSYSDIHTAALAPTKAEMDAWMKQATTKSNQG